MFRGLRVAALLVPLLVLCAGCTQSPPKVVTPSTRAVTSAAPVFRSNAEALAAAKATYKQYLKLSATVVNSGSKSVKALSGVVTPTELVEEQHGLDQVLKLHYTSMGHTSLVRMALQSANFGTGKTVAYACVDYSKAKVRDAKGRDRSLKGALQRQTSLATFEWNGSRLLLADNGTWNGRSIC